MSQTTINPDRILLLITTDPDPVIENEMPSPVKTLRKSSTWMLQTKVHNDRITRLGSKHRWITRREILFLVSVIYSKIIFAFALRCI
jgi:hypothetical protein